MFLSLLRFELRYQSRQLSWWLGLLLLTAFGYLLSGRVVISGNVQVLSPQNITYAMTILSQLTIFTTTLITANAVLRDIRYDFASLVNTKPVSQTVLVMSRFFSLYIMSLLIVLSAILAIILPIVLPRLLGDLDVEIYGAFAVKNLLWPLFIIVLPNLFFTCCILFFSASIFRTTMMTFLSGIAIYVLYIISAALLDSPMFVASDPLTKEALNLASLFDPFAVSAFLEQTQFWTSAEKNTLLVNLQGSLLLNRLLWAGVSSLLLLIAMKWQQGGYVIKPKSTKNRQTPPKAVQQVNSAINRPINRQTRLAKKTIGTCPRNNKITLSLSFSRWLAFKTEVMLELKMTLRGMPFIVLLLFVVVMVIAQLINAISLGVLVGEQYPYTSLLLPHVIKSLEIIGLFVVVFYCGEMVWRAKEVNFYCVLNTSPTPPWLYFMAKIFVMAILILIMLTVSILSAIGYQLYHGFYATDLTLFLSLIPLYALPLLWLAILCFATQYMVSNKFVGFIISAALLLVLRTDVATALGLNHNLLKFSGTGSIRYSDFNGYDFFLTNIVWFSLYWCLVSAVIALIAYGVSKRAIDESLLSAIKKLRFYLAKGGMAVLQMMVLLVMLCASYIFYNTNVINHYQSANAVEQYQINYERTFSPYQHSAMPQITAVYTEVAFTPTQHRVDIKGHYWLENTAGEGIKKLLITLPNENQTFTFELNRAFSVKVNKALNVYEIDLFEVLQPQEKVKLTFSTRLVKKGFNNTDQNLSLLENGSYFHSASLFPYIGYNASYEIADKKKRAEYGLGKKNPLKPLSATTKYSEHSLQSDASWVNFEAIVSTEEDQIATSPGELQQHWSAQGRNYYHYKIAHKVANFFAFSSARYQLKTQRFNNIQVKAYYHPTHDKNINEMIATAGAALEYYQAQFGPYPFKELTLVEIPYRSFARAYPGIVYISENVGFKENLNSASNLNDFSNLVAHEISHQWWGHQLTAAKTEGAMLLIESLADYSALMVMKKRYGEGYVKKSVARSTRKYLKGRSADQMGETFLAKMLGQHYLRYEKGPVIYNALRHLIGEQQLNQSLSNLLKEKAFVATNYATSYDLISHIKAVAGNEFDSLIDEWLMQIAIYDLRVEEAHIEKLANGHYKVTATLAGNTFKFSKEQDIQELPFVHPVPFAIYATDTKATRLLYQQSIELVNGKKLISIILDEKPSKIIVDPNLMFIDRNSVDNRSVLSEL